MTELLILIIFFLLILIIDLSDRKNYFNDYKRAEEELIKKDKALKDAERRRVTEMRKYQATISRLLHKCKVNDLN